ncbi:cytochrome P450 2C31-like [Oppia nitens]|uniref:cytochrome P450 2C31-like n=1 Tax=Oppia nitens TaxID=1686743 RepID=UPI0023DAAD80|nr:cytochrome P450 2C31-like [Oppia nitens]
MFLLAIIYLIFSNAITLLSVITVYFVITKIYSDYQIRAKLPPGPRNWPLIGNLESISGATSKTFVEWSKKYGPVIGLQMGSSPTIILNDWPSIKDAFSQDTTLARPKDNIFSIIGPEGFGSMSGQVWREQRRFLLHKFRDLGFGKTSMEDHIIDEINHLSELIDKTLDTETNTRELFGISVSNNVSSFIFGRRLDYLDNNKKVIDELVKPNPSLSLTSAFAQFPAVSRFVVNKLSFLLPQSNNDLQKLFDNICNIMKNEIKSHEKTLDSNNFRDYMDAFITESQKNANDSKTSFNNQMLVANSMNLYGAGTATTTQTLEWSLLVLATHPEVQLKIQKEIDDIIGRYEIPKYGYRNQMPYLQAFIYEVLRYRSIVPIDLPRSTSEDTIIGGHKIPKGTQILANFWAIDNDPKLWDNPQVFKPERFLKDNGTTFFRPDHFIPFSYGKRSCPGEVLGLAEIFLYIVSLLQKYDIKPTKNTDTTLDYKIQFSVIPKAEPVVCFNKRV